MTEHCTIIGVDCATDPKNKGLARGIWEEGCLQITDVTNGQFHEPEEIVSEWVANAEKGLIALDAPIGWPQDFGYTLANHVAGMPLQNEANQFFRRETDRFVQRTFKKVPLDVGAETNTILAGRRIGNTGRLVPAARRCGCAGCHVMCVSRSRFSFRKNLPTHRPGIGTKRRLDLDQEIIEWSECF